ncbi:protein IQ-DOMAIN 1 isoform X1 [Camellia sinensis]|uniref:protein IQ-DOMAIN 1 isoform X1 n=1 Tax=Camellia sinensis TaxID=4442 RepID=UPI0010367CDB|nr:protein IQ-DOMAIN 1 isoform X1 [Camellia sinensis]
MGITGELVRSVFSKSHSVGTHDTNARNSAVERRRWRSSVRSYLCGDEFNSVAAEEDSASVRSYGPTMIQQPMLESSEASVTQPILEDLAEKEDIQSNDTKQELQEEKQNSTATLFRREDAALVIQSAFRGFLARRRNGAIETVDGKLGVLGGGESPSKESLGTSIEVQTGNSMEVFSIPEETMTVHHRFQQQKARTPVLKLKLLQEDWDDSTVSSNISKMRMQNRLEATTRRERALAYAFSQQLRICSKKKQNRSDGTTEPNMGWSWLERWMATRLPESSPFENSASSININQRSMVARRLFDVGGEEKESCGSNDVSVQFDSISVSAAREKDDTKPTKNRLKATRNKSRRKTFPSYNYKVEHVSKECPGEDENDKKQKQKQAGRKRENTCKDATVSPEIAASDDSCKLGFY